MEFHTAALITFTLVASAIVGTVLGQPASSQSPATVMVDSTIPSMTVTDKTKAINDSLGVMTTLDPQLRHDILNPIVHTIQDARAYRARMDRYNTAISQLKALTGNQDLDKVTATIVGAAPGEEAAQDSNDDFVKTRYRNYHFGQEAIVTRTQSYLASLPAK